MNRHCLEVLIKYCQNVHLNICRNIVKRGVHCCSKFLCRVTRKMRRKSQVAIPYRIGVHFLPYKILSNQIIRRDKITNVLLFLSDFYHLDMMLLFIFCCFIIVALWKERFFFIISFNKQTVFLYSYSRLEYDSWGLIQQSEKGPDQDTNLETLACHANSLPIEAISFSSFCFYILRALIF